MKFNYTRGLINGIEAEKCLVSNTSFSKLTNSTVRSIANKQFNRNSIEFEDSAPIQVEGLDVVILDDNIGVGPKGSEIVVPLKAQHPHIHTISFSSDDVPEHVSPSFDFISWKVIKSVITHIQDSFSQE